MTLYCATTNPGKIAEFVAASSDAMKIVPLPGMSGIPPCEETGSTFEDNAIQKALHYGPYIDGWLFAEDSGLEVDALGGAPGVYSARFAGPQATDEDNNELLLKRLRDSDNRGARFVCVIALVRGGKNPATFRGHVEGEILTGPRGVEGFGYDPLFYYPPFGCSFGEVSQVKKQTVSHRAKAFYAMRDYLKRNSP